MAIRAGSIASAVRPREHEHARRPDYSRQIALKEVGATGQARLHASRVLVIGAGGLGVPVLSYLAGAGVGTLGIVDGDVLEASNLHRQPLYALGDVGKLKAQLAAERLHALNPEVHCDIHTERFDVNNARRLVEQYDLATRLQRQFCHQVLAERRVRAGAQAGGLCERLSIRGTASDLSPRCRAAPACVVCGPTRLATASSGTVPKRVCSVRCRACSEACRQWKH